MDNNSSCLSKTSKSNKKFLTRLDYVPFYALFYPTVQQNGGFPRPHVFSMVRVLTLPNSNPFSYHQTLDLLSACQWKLMPSLVIQ